MLLVFLASLMTPGCGRRETTMDSNFSDPLARGRRLYLEKSSIAHLKRPSKEVALRFHAENRTFFLARHSIAGGLRLAIRMDGLQFTLVASLRDSGGVEVGASGCRGGIGRQPGATAERSLNPQSRIHF